MHSYHFLSNLSWLGLIGFIYSSPLITHIITLATMVYLSYFKLELKMPQALPFYFTNQIVFVLGGMAVLVYLVSVYLLPPMLQLLVTRSYVSKL